MKRSHRYLAGFAVLLGVAMCCMGLSDFGKPYQDLADRLPRGDGLLKGDAFVGGRIELPAGDVRLTTPLLIGSGVEVVGKGWGATRLYYDGEGAAVRFSSYAGHHVHMGGSVHDLAIYSKNGDGIAIDESVEAEAPSVRNVVLNVGGTGIDFHRKGTLALYFPTIENVFVAFAGNRAIDVFGYGVVVDRLNFCNPARPVAKGVRPTSMISVDGSGVIRDSRIEGTWNTALLRVRGNWNLTNNYIEPHAGTTEQVILEGWDGQQAHAANIIMDRPYFVQPQKPYVLRGQVVVNILSSDLGSESNEGAPNEPVANCFKLEGPAKLLCNGKQILPPP